MEVAGLVLGVVGVLPVIIDVVEKYQVLVEIKRVKRYMAVLGQDLDTQRIILTNTYERLLNGIVPAWELDSLKAVEPSSAKWHKYDAQIRYRLRESYQDFLSRAKTIAEAVQDLQEKLATSPSGKVRTSRTRKKFKKIQKNSKNSKNSKEEEEEEKSWGC